MNCNSPNWWNNNIYNKNLKKKTIELFNHLPNKEKINNNLQLLPSSKCKIIFNSQPPSHLPPCPPLRPPIPKLPPSECEEINSITEEKNQSNLSNFLLKSNFQQPINDLINQTDICYWCKKKGFVKWYCLDIPQTKSNHKLYALGHEKCD